MSNNTGRRRKNSIESSGTYLMLVEMGFDASVSLQAASIYLNDVERAVNYCTGLYGPVSSRSIISESNSSDSETSSASIDNNYNITETPIYYQPGSYFAKCYDILQQKYPQFVGVFNEWFKEEEFEDNQLLDEFIENEEYEESFFMQYLEDNYKTYINKQLLKTLYNDLVNVINGINIVETAENNANMCEQSQTKLIDGFVHGIQSEVSAIFGIIPFKVYTILQQFYASDLTLTMNPQSYKNEELMYYIRELYAMQCDVICHDILSMDETYLFALYIIGQENKVPLLTYFADAYSRYNIQNWKELIAFESIPLRLRNYSKVNVREWLKYDTTNEFCVRSENFFIKNRCTGIKSKTLRYMSAKSIKYLTDGRRISKPTVCNNTSIYRINDSIMDYASCIFESYDFVAKYVSNIKNCNKMPLQFDVWIVPNSVQKVDGELIRDNINDIDAKLIENNVKYYSHNGINYEKEGSISNLMYNSTSKLLKNKKNERCCLIIDRRNEYNNKLYVYQPTNDSKFIECNNANEFINESLHNNSFKCVLPSFGGVKQEANGYMFNLSFHCISKYEIRVYLYIDTFGTRFFIQDITDYLNQFFVDKQSELLKKNINANQFKKRFNGSRNLLNDLQFDKFYKLILKDQNVSPY